MCGITGFLYKDKDHFGPVGEVEVRMLRPLFRRGPDSTGVALYGPPQKGYVLRARLEAEGASANGAGSEAEARAAIERLAEVGDVAASAGGLRATLSYEGELGALADAIEAADDALDVLSLGHSMEIVKEVGSAANLDRSFGVSKFKGSHAIGHTRMATESRVDTLHSHPFWARPFADIALVHNGHITNEHKLKRRLAAKGHRFFTGNDSEVLAVYLADKLEQGAVLEDALRDSVSELDGTFAYLVSTADGIGLARDPFGTKPLLWAETDDFVVLASEDVAIRAAFPDEDLTPQELGAGEVRSWHR